MAQELLDGEPCPVCGSREHPAPARLSAQAPREAELKAANEDGVALIARHMNYGLYRVEGKADCPKDALNILRMLSVKREILERIEEAYKE